MRLLQNAALLLEFKLTVSGAASTIVLGVPVPSANAYFLGIVALHIAFGLSAVITGFGAMLSRKGRGRHSRYGTAYFWALAGVLGTMSVLSVMRWSDDYQLFILGTLAFAAAYFGRRNIPQGHVRWHLAGMGTSYILTLTAFYVDNEKNLPLWNRLPQITFWVLPSIIGLPLVAYYLVRLPRFKP